MVNNKKFVSKVDEKLKAAEARRAELERAKAEEMQKKIAMRRNRMKKPETDENKKSNGNTVVLPVAVPKNIREYGCMRLANGKLIKLNWNNIQKKKGGGYLKMFTIKCVENLIEKEQFGLAEVVLGILKRSIEARHPIQNKFAHLHGRIAEIKEKNKRVYAYESALNFTGSISPIRVPEFEVDLGQLSRISSPPAGMEELERKYSNIEELADAKTGGDITCKYVNVITKDYEPVYGFNESNYSFDNDNDNNNDNDNDSGVNAADTKTPTKLSPKKTNNPTGNNENNFPTVISPMKRPHKEIEAEVVYTPQRKSGRRLNEEEIIYDDENVSQILLNDPNAAFISNPYITMRKKNNGGEGKQEE